MTTDPTPPKSPDPSGQPIPAEAPHATFAQAAGAVFWSFFGVRKGRDMREDALKLKPHHVIVVGLLSGLLLVFVLLAVVRLVTRGL